MRRVALIATTVAVLCVASTAGAITDPRQCAGSLHGYGCAQSNAEAALVAHMRRASNGHWSAVNVYCKSSDPKLLRWSCRWGRATVGHATVRFYATSSVWHVQVSLG